MATGTIPPNAKGDARAAAPPAETAAYVERRIHETRRHVKGVDVAGGLMSLAVGGLAYLLVGAVIDQWLMPGGLGFWGRFLLMLGLLGAGGWYFYCHLLPPLLYRINPIFAAQVIERSRPTLKNSLINFLLLRGHRQEVPVVVYQALEQRAAIDLSQVHVETAVDRRPVIRLGYVLAGVFAVFCLYLTLSPKSTMASVARILWPWAGTQAPTRVAIDEVEPGNAARPQGESVTVMARVKGLRSDEPVTLIYSSADGQVVEQAIPMTWSEGDLRYTAKLPPGKAGLQQDYTYRLTAGDCTTPDYRLEVLVALSMAVDAVDYAYPPYTKLENRTLENLGDLRGIEGTEATIRASANVPIGQAEIDLGGDGRHRLKMRTSGETKAVGTLLLRSSADDPARAEFESYQLRFTDREGRKNRTPSRYSIEVLADQKPEIEVSTPQEKEVQVPLDGQLDIRVRAKDPDFALRKVVLRAKREGDTRELKLRPLLDLPAPKEPWTGEFEGALVFKPSEQKEVKLAKGDRIAYWAEAEDNREVKNDLTQWTPAPNRTATEKRYIVIAAPQPQEQPKPNDGSKQPTPAARNKNDAGQSKPGEPGQGGDTSKTDENPAEGNSGENPPSKPGENPPPKPGDGSESKPGEPTEPGTGQDDPQNGGAGEMNPGEGKPGENKPGEGTPGENTNGNDSNNGQPGESNNGQSGDNQAGEKPPGEKGAAKPDKKSLENRREPVSFDDDGKAIEEMLNDQKQQAKKGEKPQGKQPGDQGQGKQPADQPQGKQPGDQPQGKQPGEQPQGKQPGDQAQGKQPGDQPQGKQPGDQPQGKQPGDQPQGTQPGDQPQGKQPGDQPQGKQPGDQPQGKQPGEQPQGQKPDGGEGAKKPGSGEAEQKPDAGEPKSNQGTGKPDEKPGGEPKTEQSKPGSGTKSGDDNKGGPENEADNQPKTKQKPGESGQDRSPDKSDTGQSPTTSPKQSDSKGDTEGDRSGGGKEGGGQRNPNEGTGAAGTHSDAESGGSKSKEKGGGEVGKRPGEEVESENATGSKQTVRREGESDKGTPEPGDKPGGKETTKDAPGGKEEPAKPDTGAASKESADRRGTTGHGPPTAGGAPPETEMPNMPFAANEPGGEDPNLAFARKQTNLALEHLKDQLAKEKPELLDRLGWTPDEARRFVEKWERLQRAAAVPDSRGKSAKRELDDALKSLGLRRPGTEIKGGAGRDNKRGLYEAGRAAPPPEWAETVRDYQRGVAEGGK